MAVQSEQGVVPTSGEDLPQTTYSAGQGVPQGALALPSTRTAWEAIMLPPELREILTPATLIPVDPTPNVPLLETEL